MTLKNIRGHQENNEHMKVSWYYEFSGTYNLHIKI